MPIITHDPKGSKQSQESSTGPCQKAACDIQACLSKNGYVEARCRNYIKMYEECIKNVNDKE